MAAREKKAKHSRGHGPRENVVDGRNEKVVIAIRKKVCNSSKIYG